MNKLISPNVNLHKVLPDEFDLDQILVAFREGRLYIKPVERSGEEILEDGIAQILRYVSHIDACVSQEHHAHMRSLWNSVLRDETLQPLCFMTKGKRKGKPNWYRITSIVSLLREWNIYRKRDFTAVDLHLLLEGISKRNAIYESSTHYYLEHREMQILRKILANLQKSEE